MKNVSSLSAVASMLLAIRDARSAAAKEPQTQVPAIPVMSAEQARVLLNKPAGPQRYELRCQATQPAAAVVDLAAALVD